MATSQLTPKQNQKMKSPVVDINHWLNQVFPAFNNTNKELSPSFCLIDTFSNHFSFNIVKWKDTEVRTTYLRRLDNIYKFLKDNPNIFVIVGISVQDNIAISLMHIYRKHVIIIFKTIHYTINVTSTKAELFAIRYSIN